MNCPLCGKRVVAGRGNSTIVDGVLVHKRCPNSNKNKTQEPDMKDKKELIEAIKVHLALRPKGYVVETGLNFMKVFGQIRQLKDKGYSYKEQLYALDKVVEKQGGFYGYTSVVNNIDVIIIRKREQDRIKKEIETKKSKDILFDPSRIMESGDDEW